MDIQPSKVLQKSRIFYVKCFQELIYYRQAYYGAAAKIMLAVTN
jgi:hypothetical protein